MQRGLPFGGRGCDEPAHCCFRQQAGLYSADLQRVIDTTTRTVALANAGQPPVYHYHANTGVVEAIEHHAYPPGVRRDTTSRPGALRYRPGDTVVFYTDGLVEAWNAKGETFERLEGLLAWYGKSSATDLQATILAELRTFLGELAAKDDITLSYSSLFT